MLYKLSWENAIFSNSTVFLQGLLNSTNLYIGVLYAIILLTSAGDKKKDFKKLNLKPLLIPFIYLANTY